MSRIAIIGMGAWGKNLIRVFSRLSDVKLCCNHNNREDHAWLTENYPAIAATCNVEDVFLDGSIDAIVIAAPIESHASLALRGLNAGKHVFMEKPMATSLEEAQQLLKVASEKSKRLFVGHIFLFHPIFDCLRQALADDPVKELQLYWFKFGSFKEDILWDLLPHEFSVAIRLFDKMPTEAQLISGTLTEVPQNHISLKLQFPQKGLCYINVDRCFPTRRKVVKVITQSGRMFVWEGDELFKRNQGSEFVRMPIKYEEPLSREARAFLSSIENNTNTISDGDLGLKVLEALVRLDRLRVKNSRLTGGPRSVAADADSDSGLGLSAPVQKGGIV